MWILILFIFSGSSVRTEKIHFKSEKACIEAADEISEIEEQLNGKLARVDAFCFKGAK